MTCESIQEELVAYRDGELSEHEQFSIATHLATCAECAREEAQLIKMAGFLTSMERITPSPNFATSFWERIEQEKARGTVQPPSRLPVQGNAFVRWWQELRATLTTWQVVPAFAAAASVLIFFGYLMTSSSKPPSVVKAPQEKSAANAPAPEALANVAEKLEFFVNYKVIADLERLSHFDEIAEVELPGTQAVEVAQEEEVPPDVLQNPSFFTHYPLLKRMEQLQSLEAVLDNPTGENEQNQG